MQPSKVILEHNTCISTVFLLGKYPKAFYHLQSHGDTSIQNISSAKLQESLGTSSIFHYQTALTSDAIVHQIT